MQTKVEGLPIRAVRDGIKPVILPHQPIIAYDVPKSDSSPPLDPLSKGRALASRLPRPCVGGAFAFDGDLQREEWIVQSLPTHGEAVAILKAIHYAKSAANTSTYRHGLYRREKDIWPLVREPWGVALWIPPTKGAARTVDENWQGVLSLSRFAVVPEAPRNAASYFLAASMRLIDRTRWPTLLTYADTAQGHTGSIYKATNWECLGPVVAGDTWSSATGQQAGRKRGRRTLKRAEMLALGFTPNADAPKIKFVHRQR